MVAPYHQLFAVIRHQRLQQRHLFAERGKCCREFYWKAPLAAWGILLASEVMENLVDSFLET